MEVCERILSFLETVPTLDAPPAASEDTSIVVKIVSWNVFREPMASPWESRKDQVFAKLKSFDADLIALQELHGPSFDSDFVGFLSLAWQAVVQTPTGSGQRNWCGLLYRTDRFLVVEEVHKSAGIVVGLKDLRLGASVPLLWVCVVHLNGGISGPEFGNKVSYTRYCQMKSLLQKSLSTKLGNPKEAPPLIVCGDFNCEGNALPHRMLRDGRLDKNAKSSEGLAMPSKLKYNTGWKLTDLYQELSPRPGTFLFWMDFDGGLKYKKHITALRHVSRFLLSGRHFSLDKYISFVDYEEYMKGKGTWGYTQDWNPLQENRNWFGERDMLDLILHYAYGEFGSLQEENSLDYIYFSPNHFEKIRHTLPASKELLKKCFEVEQLPNAYHPSDHFPVSVELKRTFEVRAG